MDITPSPHHPDLDFWVDVELRRYDDRRWVAVADFAQEPDGGTAFSPRDAVRDALKALGEPHATEMAEGAILRDGLERPWGL